MYINRTVKCYHILEFSLNLNGVAEKLKSNRKSTYISQDYKYFWKKINIEIEQSPSRLHSGTGVVDGTIDSRKLEKKVI